MSPDSIVSAMPASPSQTITTLKDETGHLRATRLALHIPLMAPHPLRDFAATPVFVMAT